MLNADPQRNTAFERMKSSIAEAMQPGPSLPFLLFIPTLTRLLSFCAQETQNQPSISPHPTSKKQSYPLNRTRRRSTGSGKAPISMEKGDPVRGLVLLVLLWVLVLGRM